MSSVFAVMAVFNTGHTFLSDLAKVKLTFSVMFLLPCHDFSAPLSPLPPLPLPIKATAPVKKMAFS